MDRDLTRQIVTVVAVLATLVVNSLAVTLPIGGMSTAAISDSFRVFVIPSGGTFAVWSVIYTLLLAFAVLQALPSRRHSPFFRALGYLPAVTCAFNAGWIFLWQYRLFVPTLAAMAGLLLSLIAIGVVIRRSTGRDGAGLGRAERWLVGPTFSVYLGWITVATILNVAVALASLGVTGLFGLAPELIGGLVLIVGLAIATSAVVIARDVAYGLVVIWAYYGIWVKESATPYVGGLAVAAIVVLLLAVGIVLAARLTGTRRAPSVIAA